MENKASNQLSFEESYKELENIVTSLENSDNTLSESLKLFERGQFLARYCIKLLDTAELQVQQIIDGEISEFKTSD